MDFDEDNSMGFDQEDTPGSGSDTQEETLPSGIGIMDASELNETQKLQLAERANEIYRQQLKYMQDHLASMRALIQDKENIIENLMLRYDLGIITQDPNRQGGNLAPDEIPMEELRRKAEALAERTILENFELREMVNELRDENFHLRNEIYELQDKISRQVLLINKLEKSVQQGVGKVTNIRQSDHKNMFQDIDDEREQDEEDILEDIQVKAEAKEDVTEDAEEEVKTDVQEAKEDVKEEVEEHQKEATQLKEAESNKEITDKPDTSGLNETQKLQLAERANEIYRAQLKYLQEHLASLRSLIQDKENIIENLMLRYDLGITTHDSNGQSGANLGPDEIEMEELRRKAEALAQRTILENHELREMVNELRDENFHLRNEIYELQDKINRQVLQINKLEKSIAESNTTDVFAQLRNEIGELQDKINEQVNKIDKTVQERVRNENEANAGGIMQHDIDVSSITISQMKQTLDLSNRPTMETLVIAGVLDLNTVNQYYYTLDTNQINHMIREKLDYKANVIQVFQQYPDDVLHSQSAQTLNVIYKKQKIYFLLQTVVSGHSNARALITQEESEVRSLMAQMNVQMQTLRERLERYVDPDHPDLNTDEEELQTDFANIQTRLSSITSKQKAIHQRLRMLHDVERDMISRTFAKQYRSFLESQAMMDADIKQLQTLEMTDGIRQAIDELMTAKNNAERDIHKAMIHALQTALDQHQQIGIARTQATDSASEFKLTFQYSVFVVNLFHLQYVDTLSEPIKRTIAAYAADHLYIDPDLTVRDVVKQMDANTYTTQHRQTLLNRKDLLSLSVHRSVRIIHDTSDDDECVPLHCFTSEDICGTIEQWLHNDRKYKKYQLQTQNVFSKKRNWTGSKLSRLIENDYLSANDIKSMLRMDLNSFISPDTLDIVFACFDRWMKDNPEIESLSAEEIGSIFYDFPLNQLLDTIRDKGIDGAAWAEMYAKQELEAFIKERTGWNEEEIYQINAVLFMHKTWTKHEFMDNMTRIMNDETLGLASAFKEVIKQTILEFNVEKLHFKIKHGMEINAFSDTAINLVDYVQDMNDEYVKNGHADAYKEDDLVRRVYECIADCFILKYDDTAAEQDEDHDVDEFSIRLDKQTPWICGNCSNFNFHKCIGGTIQSDVSICSLCGIHQRDAIILKLKNYDTYIMVSARKQQQYEEDDEETYGAIDSLIKTASDHPSYSLQCPNRNDDTPCPSMITLARNLIIYKRWIDTVYKKTNGKDGIDKTIHIDIAKYINDKQYQVVFMECAKSNRLLTASDLELITQLLADNADDIGVCATFVGWKRLTFIKWFRKHSKRKIKPAALGRLYVTIMKALRKQAQVPQFGEFLSDIAMRGIDKDYYHILKTHVYQGTKETIKNVFRFFSTVIHYEDTHQQIEECRACKRRQDRINRDHDHQMHDANGEIQMKNRVRNTNHCDDKQLWSLQQYYIQSQLDKIHSYLVHSNWKYFVQRYGTNNAAEEDAEDDPLSKEEGKEMEMETDAMVTADAAAQKSKFTSDSDSYGFGVDHSYPHLTDKYCSIQDELVLNSLYPITVNDFQNLLIKAIKTYEIALGKGYKEELVCKYFDLDYNILRNEPIQMRHILSLIIYTDLTQFCTALRQTYRKMNDETEEEEVSERHQQLYHYSRSLFEAVEFYGSYMEPHLTVYHGLNKVLYFNNFTAYFYQPISTTTSLAVANQFSNGGGIILSLKSGSGAQQSEDTIPKYLNVSWLSNFPHEDEKLFYGGYEVFQITNIIEAASSIGHAKELFMFNKFQQMIQNHKVEWNMKNKLEKKMVKALVTLIEHEQQSAAKESSQTIQNNKLITKYGMNLFHYFCANSETTRVEIKNVKSLPLKIYNALFTAQNNKLSFIPITNVFTCLQEMLLTELENGLFTKESKKYVDAAMQYIQQSKAHHTLSKITLQSERQRDRKTNATLRKLANYNAKKFKQLKWKIEYAFREYDTHILMFRKLD